MEKSRNENNIIKPIKIKTTEQVIHKIYGYVHPNYPLHYGYIKIGETDRDVYTRVKEDHTTNDVDFKIVYQTLAINNKNEIFSDRDLREYLANKGYQIKQFNYDNRNSEWVKINLEDLKKEVENFKNGNFLVKKIKGYMPYILRKEQKEAVEKTYVYYNSCINDKGKSRDFLWNAKPRFGKTLTTYDFAKRIDAKKVLILTNRPAIQDSWYSDYIKFLYQYTDYLFLSSKPIEIKFGDKKYLSMTRQKQIEYNLVDKPYIFFISLQDIKGLSDEKEFKSKNKWLFAENMNPWDLIVIDESHEGVDTKKSKFVLDSLNKKFVLYLSGTPFKAIANGDFSNDQIYNWTYSDEQEAKLNWNDKNGTNPYKLLPRMNIYTYQLSRVLQIKLEDALKENNSYAFDLNDFFSVENGRFIYENEINKFLDNLSGLNKKFNLNNKPYPFANENIRNELKHTFWLLPNRVEICRLMKDLLKKHKVFKDYEVILCAGNGDDEHEGKKALDKVKKAIEKYDKTITLSCGQLTTGVTVPEWTGVIMLSNTESSTQYLQAAFRAQNKWEYTDPTTLETKYKTDCYLFDFAPDRVLKIVADYADSLISSKDNISREKKIKTLLNFLTVIAEDDEGKLKELDAKEILEMPLKIINKEVVSRGFMSNKLFQNIANVFHASSDIREIINKLTPEKNKKIYKSTEIDNHNISVDDSGNIIIKQDEIERVINTSNGLLNDKKYVIEGSQEAQRLEEISTKYNTDDIEKEKQEDTNNLTNEEKHELNNTEIVTEDQYEEIIKDDLIKQKEKEKNTEEEQIRDRLRGFSRTIPMFLMAYSKNKQDITINNFASDIPADEFRDITSITKEEFGKLKEAKLFDENVFNGSIKEFIDTKKKFANYFINTDEDIFDYIPPQKTNQIFTPKNIVKMMIDILEKNNPKIFENPDLTFIDLYMKSGLYIAEIVKRLYKGLENEISDPKKRIMHILTKQVYGLAPTQILYNICTEYILGFLNDNNKFSKEEIDDLSNNFKKIDLLPYLKNNVEWREEVFGYNMKFDVVVGNPPYQIDSGNTSSDVPVYNYFIDNSEKIADKVCLIHPARFLFNAGKTVKSWNKKMLNDKSLSVEFYEQNSNKIFSNTDIKGGVCITYWDKNRNNAGLNGHFIHIEILKKIAEKVQNGGFDEMVSSRNPYKLGTSIFKKSNISQKNVIFNYKKINKNDIEIIGLDDNNKRIVRYISESQISTIPYNHNKYKIFIAKANGSGVLGEILSTPLIGKPKVGCTETFLTIGSFDTEKEANYCLKYIKSKFTRCMLGILKITQDNPKNVWKKVPLFKFDGTDDIDFSKSIDDIDKQLYKKYKLNKEEIEFIEKNVKKME